MKTMKTMTKQLFGGSLMVFASLAFTACGDVDNPLEEIVAPNSDNPITPTTTTITLNLDDKIFSNDKLFLLPGDAAINIATITEGAPVTITSSDENVITIDADGNVVPVGLGTATITIKVTENQQYTGATETVTIVVGRKVSLADETGTEFVAQEGDQISGTAPNTMHLSIPDGLFVRLKDATIKPTTGAESAAIVCQGDATLFLEGSNIVKGMNKKAGIQVGPEGKSLTFDGIGQMEVTAGGTGANNSGAGIGSSENGSCGNIIINDGTITAQAGLGSAIGSGKSGGCQDIEINGGTVVAKVECYQATTGAGIGSGSSGGTCGNITINGGKINATTKTTITTGHPHSAGIGTGNSSSCGNITITGGTVVARSIPNSSGLSGGAAGIGCGYNSSSTQTCGDITITGGVVKAYGSIHAAGIGTGNINGGTINLGSISVTGGTVYAQGTVASLPDIGRGSDSNKINTGTITVAPSVTYNGTKGYTQSGDQGYNRVP